MPSARLVATLATLNRRLRDLRAAAGVVLLAGGGVAAAGMLAFSWLASRVVRGRTQAFDDAALAWFGAHRNPTIEQIMLEVTLLGTGTVVMMIAAVAALFLALTRHRASALLLLASSIGAVFLNTVLKAAFDRPRPHAFPWATTVVTTSFPSGHAMGAAAVYGTVAFLAARLEPQRAARNAIVLVAAIVTTAIGFSRVYLGVHYPTDVLAGLVVGWTWAAFCAATLEALQRVVRRGRRRRYGDADTVDQAPGPTRLSNIRS